MQIDEALKKMRGVLGAVPLKVEYNGNAPAGSWQAAMVSNGLAGLVDWLLADLSKKADKQDSAAQDLFAGVLNVLAQELGGTSSPAKPPAAKTAASSDSSDTVKLFEAAGRGGIKALADFLHTQMGLEPPSSKDNNKLAKKDDDAAVIVAERDTGREQVSDVFPDDITSDPDKPAAGVANESSGAGSDALDFSMV